MNDTETIQVKIQVTKDDLDHCSDFEDGVRDYPLYGHTSNLCKADIILLSKLMKYEFGNDATLDVTITARLPKRAA